MVTFIPCRYVFCLHCTLEHVVATRASPFMQCIWCNKIVEEYTAAAEKQTEPHVYEVSALAYKGLLGEGENRPEPGPGYVHKTRGMRAKPSHLLQQTGKQRPSRFS